MSTAARDSINEGIIQALAPGTCQAITTSGSSAASSAFAASTRVVRVVATQNVNFMFGASPTATTSMNYLPAGQVEYFKVTGGEKVAVIQNSAAGTFYVTEMI